MNLPLKFAMLSIVGKVMKPSKTGSRVEGSNASPAVMYRSRVEIDKGFLVIKIESLTDTAAEKSSFPA